MTPTQKWRRRKANGEPMRKWTKHGLSKDMKEYMRWYRQQRKA